MKKVIFLDRDGVMNQDSPDYIKSWDEFKFIPGSLDALKNLTIKGFNIIIITNQSAVARKMISLQDLDYIHFMMRKAVKQHGGKIQDIFFCPHHPDEKCTCRKPKPGMIYQAKQKYKIDLSKTVMIGDSAKDIECAINAGCRDNVLVMTGNGIKAEKILADKGIKPGHTARNLQEAVDLLSIHSFH